MILDWFKNDFVSLEDSYQKPPKPSRILLKTKDTLKPISVPSNHIQGPSKPTRESPKHNKEQREYTENPPKPSQNPPKPYQSPPKPYQNPPKHSQKPTKPSQNRPKPNMTLQPRVPNISTGSYKTYSALTTYPGPRGCMILTITFLP